MATARADTGIGLTLTLTLGLFAALVTMGAAMAGAPVLAVGLPIALALAAAIVVRPEAGMLVLVFISYLDGLSDMVFRASPVSGFKIFTALTLLSIVLNAHRMRPHLRAAARSPIAQLTLAFLMVWALAILFADSRSQAIAWGGRLFTIALLVFVLLLTIRTERIVALAIGCLALSTLISGVVLILDTLLHTTLVSTTEAATTARTSGGFDRSSGASQANPTTAATMLLTGTIIALVHAIESPRLRGFFTAAAAIGTLAVVLSFARSAALVYAIVMIAIAARYGRSRYFGPAAVLAVIFAIAMLPFVPEQYWNRLGTIFGGGGADWTLGRRLTYNVIGLELLWQNPILGIGPGNFFEAFTDPAYRYLPGRTLAGRQLHNMYLSVAVEYGLLGFGIFAALIITAFRLTKQVIQAPASADLQALAVALRFGMAAYFLTCLFLPNEYNKYTWLLPALSGALFIVNRARVVTVNT
ncbi:O-antigen ligase family protein [Tropicibacter naphthalenivorans]|uniref:Putative O-glycosylation ligase, exosortase A-associated n=1 Tax=Tropicibacter naphthalenivorans TaxID=441103 RepID=A0A0N7LYI4_9RHOB|nr:O-antigen ligase family protein [Tropicibacter naphthalenivorans]CUH74953.1 putative O-glycosylation ligase, exosortase A-associated [Tropicibacter naphthalenivorans]SMC47861.1 O-antigen ligase [Tropicibacter naphthalenivorans]